MPCRKFYEALIFSQRYFYDVVIKLATFKPEGERRMFLQFIFVVNACRWMLIANKSDVKT